MSSKKAPADLLREIASEIEKTDMEMESINMSAGLGGDGPTVRRLTIELFIRSREEWDAFRAWFEATTDRRSLGV